MPSVQFGNVVPTLTGGNLTLDAMLQFPNVVTRALRTIPQQRFISDHLLTGRAPAQGGAIMVGQTESIFASLAAEAITPGAEFPESAMGGPPFVLFGVKKWGLDVPVAYEAIRRFNFDLMARAALKAGNSTVLQVDKIALATIAASGVNTLAATAAWTAGGAAVMLDVETAVAGIIDANQGYMPDTLVLSAQKFAVMTSNSAVINAMRREDPNNPVYSGLAGLAQSTATTQNAADTKLKLFGLNVWAVPAANMPAGVTVMVLDSSVLGGMADEEPFSVSPILEQKTERWLVRAKRITTPYVMEPAAATSITGT